MTDVSLSDKYDLSSPQALVSGQQALVRLLLAQGAIDRRDGINTAGLVSGYRGSPLGGFDIELTKARATLEASNIHFTPGINEDLAMTTLAGSQQLDFLPGKLVEGVFALWYGKGPGVDRSGDAIKHANLAGVSPHGGIVMAFGDDHAGKSSTTAHQSDLTLASWDVPILYPASTAEIVDYGLAAFAMSRFSGGLVGLKLVNETADGKIVLSGGNLPAFVTPEVDAAENVHIRIETLAMQTQDARVVRQKLPRAQAFARANRLDGIRFGSTTPRLLIATAGKAYGDVIAALDLLGIDGPAAEAAGVGVYKIALLYPLEPEALVEASARAREILFVEEKRPHAEAQAKALLYGRRADLVITGKSDPEGGILLPADLPLDIVTVALAIAGRVEARIPDLAAHAIGFAASVTGLRARNSQASAPIAIRRPAFCAGCPHNTSTKVPEGSVAFTGIGCHSMALFHPERRPLPMSQMGAEGANWIGLSRFTSTPHVFQNLGDGTYMHSGSLAIRAARAAGVNVTYKILYNDAVAMTGGQPVEGGLTLSDIARQVLAEGVRDLVVVSSDPARFHGQDALPAGVSVRPREELNAVQERLRDTPGVSVLIYDQVCAAEKRRRRKSAPPTARKHVFINPAVCEGCGDCSVQSNCVAIQPLETELGRKRRIDQSACNEDLSCLSGFCPSFVVLDGAVPRRSAKADRAVVADPTPAVLGEGFDLLITGVGGTGVTTAGAILAMAARIEGHAASVYDMTGLSQKGGSVFSHVRIRPTSMEGVPVRLGAGEAHTLLACDLVAAAHPEALSAVGHGRTQVFANTDIGATAAFLGSRDHVPPRAALLDALALASGVAARTAPASSISETLLGDTIAANIVMLGVAWQSGAVPLRLESIERAIELNGRDAHANLDAFAAGRTAGGTEGRATATTGPVTLDAFVRARCVDLAAYWHRDYAERYRTLLGTVRRRTQQIEGGEVFAWAVARSAYKVMAYKDEYEVGRLYSDGRFRRGLADAFESPGRIRLLISPPLLAGKDPNSDRPRKWSVGGWIFPFLKVLSMARGLRETPFDIFGMTKERRRERELRDLYLRGVARRVEALSQTNLDEAIAFAEAPLAVRGFGPVRADAAEALIASLRGPQAAGFDAVQSGITAEARRRS